MLLVLVSLLLVATASSAHAGPRGDLIDCGDTDAPIPASPYGDGSFIVRPSTAETELPAGYEPGEIVDATDPFRSPDEVSLESTYGTAYRWWVYDVGCTGKFVAGAGTSLANIEMQVAGILPSWSHALLDTVIGDSELFAALDAPVAAATKAVADGVWGPWLPVSLLAVAALVLWRARSGHLGGALTAATTALVVLGLSSFLMQYPTESVRMVDAGVRNVTGLIASGFSDGKVLPKGSASADQATLAVDGQMDDLVRDTQYRTWLDGVFGDPDSAIAHTYGPRVFRSTHFSWAEYAAYRSDPNGEGKEILDAKQAAFKEYAEAIKRADPVAYEAFTGKNWTSRATSALVNLLVVAVPCVFLLFAGLFAVAGFVLIRLVVPLAPAAGVIFMYDKTRDLAVGWLKRVTGPLIMGPVCFLVALVLLRFTSAIFEAEDMWFVLKLGLIAVLTMIAFRLSGVLGMVPGYEHARRRITAALRTAVGTTLGAAAGTRDGLRPDQAALDAAARPRAEVAIAPGGVWHPGFEARAPSPPRELEPPDDFVPYTPPRRALSAAQALTGNSDARTTPQGSYSKPIGPPRRRDARMEFPPPPVDHRVQEPALGPKTRFDYAGREPKTSYEVDGRGIFYTDEVGSVVHAETDSGSRRYPNPDLNDPEPNMTYVVNGVHVYTTDKFGRPIKAVDPQPSPGPAYRSKTIQSKVGRAGGDGYVGGHLIMHQHGGGRERINIVAQLEEMNQSGTVRFGSIPNSFFNFERFLNTEVIAGKDVYLTLYVDYVDDQTRTPKLITAEYTIDGVTDSEDFPNVR